MREKKVPEVRFQGFRGEWETYKLENLLNVCSGQDYKHLSHGNIPVYGTGGYMLSVDKALSYTEDAIGIGRKGTIDKPYMLNAPFWTVDTLFYAIPQNNNDLYYLFCGMQKTNWKAKDESTGVPSLSKTTINAVEFSTPEYAEQTQIGEFFKNLDYLIAQNQKKYDKLVNMKKACLDKMFPKDGADTPDVRFKGFDKKWELREVSELLVERNTQSPKTEEYPLMAFVAFQGVTPKGNRYNREFLVTDEVNKKYKQTKKSDFIYSSNNLETGSIGLNFYGNASISPVYSIFHPTDIAVSDFLGRRLIRRDFINKMIKWRQGVIYGQWRIHESDFIKLDISIPCVHEQTKIGTFFQTLDNLITLRKTELEKLKNIKKACLDKIFI